MSNEEENQRRRGLLLELEDRVGHVTRTALLLGLPPYTSYAGYKNGTRKIPNYIEASLKAHLLLSKDQLDKLVEERPARY